MLLYYYLYIGISRVKEFNSIIINDINKKDFFIHINRFKTVKILFLWILLTNERLKLYLIE